MIIGIYLVCMSAYIGAWFVSRHPESPDEVKREGCCRPTILLPRDLVEWLGMMVSADRCGQVWCILATLFMFYNILVVLISFILGAIVRGTESAGDMFGWGLLLYISIELVFAMLYGIHMTISIIRRSKEMLLKYKQLSAEEKGQFVDVLKSDSELK